MRRLPLAALLLLACNEKGSGRDTPVSEIAARAESLRPQLIELRRDLHRHPELAGSESRTAGVIARELRALGLDVREGIGKHGLVGVLAGAFPGRVVGYRADMDAVRMQEPPGREYGSTVPGVFHACGHDLHSAIGVGVAGVLSSMRARLPGTVVFYFQPAEETLEGAEAMIRDGALVDPRPEATYAVHDWPFPVGTMAQGAVLAGLDRFEIRIEGASATMETANQVMAQIRSLSTVVRPRTPEEVARALTDMQDPNGPFARFINIQGPSASTVDTAVLIRGSVRASSDSMYPQIRTAVKEAVDRVLEPAAYQLSFAPEGPFPSMVSDPGLSAEAAPLLARMLGEDKVLAIKTTWPFNGEDFARFLEQAPGAMFLLGVANPSRGFSGAPHFPDFDADEEGIVVGTRAMAAVIWQRLTRN
jgi:amidohydrolase